MPLTKDTLVTIATYSGSIDAHMAKNKLESEGVMAFLFDENMVSLNPLYNISIGGIKLKTLASDAEKALEILNGMNALPYTNEQDVPVACPRCGSEDISYAYDSRSNLKNIGGFLLGLITFSLPLLSKDKYKCGQCGLEFQKDQS
ncbi:hypothetical protein TH63_03285 [Rufibacter radiotolerans]|uniref:DUF2007 domain-containing protein n=1 Tax=Rufibacter radiotolerans TaxID=1379910 RepID=A0A0H4W344_9BACT|nr:DUF2007 domain-containing protein [Rufibacter radiotolerans]AKQ44866.1 hypothetical protein TH63_03285 [Rufibacter radiotolerans]